MLKRVLCSVSTKLKNLMMAESAVSQAVTNEVTVEKRLLAEDDAPIPSAKKFKVQHAAPMEGRADRKRKVALLIAYCGAGYYGIQIQMNGSFKTIESEILKALVAAELVPQDHADTPKKMSLQRAARTDKNVSAVGSCMRTTRGFDSKTHCTARTYKYMLPTYSFAPVEKYITKEYRLPDANESIQKVNEVIAKYVGTHNFHNFTSGRKPHEDSSKRYIKSFQCGEPFMRDGMEFAVLTVTGQSFMLHHIRKMIGLMIAIVRGYCGEDVLTKSWGPRKMDIPKAPGMGLFLDELFFEGYNKKFGNDGMHEPLVWDKYRESLDKFREEHVLTHIARSEVEESVMLQWLGTLQYHKFDFIDPAEEVPPDGEKEKDPSWYKTKALLRKVDQKKDTEAEASADQGTAATADESVNSAPEHEVMGTPSSEQTPSSTTKEETSLSQQEEPMVIADMGDSSSVSMEQAQAPPEPMITRSESADMSSTEQGSVLPETPASSGESADASTSHEKQTSLLQEKPAVTAESSDTPSASDEPTSALQQEHTGSVTASSGETSEKQTTASQEKPVVSSEADAKAENEKDLLRKQS